MKRERINENTLAQVRVLEDTDETGVLHFEAIVSEADLINRNRRVYPESVLFGAFAKLNEQIQTWKMQGFAGISGLVDHPDMWSNGSISDQGIAWEGFTFEGKKVIGRGFVVPTSKGKDFAAVVQAGLPAGFSTRGWAGDSEEFEAEDGEPAKRILSLELESVDAVTDPSVFGARVRSYSKEELDTMEKELEEARAALKEAQDKLVVAEARTVELEGVRDQSNAALTEALAENEQLKARIAEMESVIAEAEKVKAEAALQARLDELLDGYRFAAAVKNEVAGLREVGGVVTLENVEALVSRYKLLVEGIASAVNEMGEAAPKGKVDETHEDEPEVPEAHDPMADLSEAQLKQLLEAKLITQAKYDELMASE